MAKRIVLMVTVAALMVLMMVPAAMAVDMQCTFLPCVGTAERDTLYERGGRGVPDEIHGRPDDDRIFADLFREDHDVLGGGFGNDTLDAQDGDGRDKLRGGPGRDVCYVDERDEAHCERVSRAIE